MSEEFFEINGHKFRKKWPDKTCSECHTRIGAVIGRCYYKEHRAKVLDGTHPDELCDVMQYVKAAMETGIAGMAGYLSRVVEVKEGKE